jgi:hypothetical protein
MRLPPIQPTAVRGSSSAIRGKAKSGTHNSVAVLPMAARSSPFATRSICRTTASSTRSVSSQGAMPGTGQFPWRAARHSDLRGHLGRCGRLRDAGRKRRRDPARAERLALLSRQDRCRHQVVLRQVIETGLPMIYANQLGGQDELVFDGASFAFNADKRSPFQMSQFEESGRRLTWKRNGEGWVCVSRADVAARSRRRPTTAPACWAFATTSTRTASRTSCSAFPAASIRRSARPLPSMRSARSESAR